MKKFDSIENLFIEEFQDAETALSLDEIEMMDKLIIKNRFYKFNPFQFNVYYAAAILTSVLINTVFIYHYMYSTHVIKKTVYTSYTDSTYTHPDIEDITVSNKTSAANSEKPRSHAVNIVAYPKSAKVTVVSPHSEINIIKNTPELVKSNNLVSTQAVTTQSPAHIRIKDSINTTDNHKIGFPKPESKIKTQKKIVYVARKDTILQVDTIKTGRRRKNK